MSGPDSISDPVACRLPAQNLIPRLAARLGSTKLAADQVGPTLLTCQLTVRWHGMMTSWLHHVMSFWACLLCMMTSQLCHADVILIRVSHMGRVNWYSGRVNPSGGRRRVGRVARFCARGQQPRQSVKVREDVRFRRCFHQWLRLFLLYIVVWSKHNFDNFYFLAKIKYHFKPYTLIPIVGISSPPCADQWCTDSCS